MHGCSFYDVDEEGRLYCAACMRTLEIHRPLHRNSEGKTISVWHLYRRIERGRRLSAGHRQYLGCLVRSDEDACRYCKVPLDDSNRTLDHVVPKSKGGTDCLDNLCLSCYECNHDKGSDPCVEQ